MAVKADSAKHRLNRDLFNAFMEGDEGKVLQLCSRIPEGALHILTIHSDTVLHMATYSKQKDLALHLLQELPQHHLDKLTRQNDIGNSMLHEAATSDRIVPAAKQMLEKAPMLLHMRNKRGETALFRASRYGKATMFEFLDAEVNKMVRNEEALRTFHRRDDMTTILHMAILSKHFGMAMDIAMRYEYLVGEQDGDGMTALQLLACSPSAFKSGRNLGSLTHLISTVGSFCRIPWWESIRTQNQKYESALKLAKFLIERDTTWEATESGLDRSKPKTHRYGGSSKRQDAKDVSGSVDIAETALFLATKSGCTDIVQEILRTYPQAVEHIDDEGRNILHVAIKYRQMQIFDIVEKMEIPMMRLLRKIDNNGNSILHMVGIKPQDHGSEDMRSPALLLREDLLLFERVEKVSPTNFTTHLNNNGQTPERLFAENNAQLRSEAKDWVKRTAENCSIVAVLIATVAFAAAYTIPGGPNQNTGYPILADHPFFVIFTLTDVLSLAFALTSVITFLSVLTSPFRFKDFKHSLPHTLMLGVTLLILSVSMMMFAFAATVILLIRIKKQWTHIVLYAVAFFPVAIFALSYLPLYVSLMKTFWYSFKKLGGIFPRFGGLADNTATTSYTYTSTAIQVHKSQAMTPSQATAFITCSASPSAPQPLRDAV